MIVVKYNVICRYHGRQFVTQEQLDVQLNKPKSKVRCPLCGCFARYVKDQTKQPKQEGEHNG